MYDGIKNKKGTFINLKLHQIMRSKASPKNEIWMKKEIPVFFFKFVLSDFHC